MAEDGGGLDTAEDTAAERLTLELVLASGDPDAQAVSDVSTTTSAASPDFTILRRHLADPGSTTRHAGWMGPSLILIHSPFLGPATWQSTARALEGRERRVHVPSLLAVAQSAPPYWPAGVDSIIRAAADEPVVLVPHSNAGLYVPAVVEALGEQVRGVVFIDAALPGSGHHSTPDFLRKLATADGLLPRWTSWWDEADVAALFPDAYMRAEVEAEQPRMPLAYYDHLPPTPHAWTAPSAGYIWFGEPYDKQAAQAAVRGWPTAHLPGTHLHMLTDPDAVAAAVMSLAGDWH